MALVDYDPQNGATICSDIAKANGSPLPFLVVKSLSEINRDEIDAVVFDHSPGVNPGGQLAPIVIVPTILDAASHSITIKSVHELDGTDKLCIVIPNRVELQNREHKDLLEMQFENVPYMKKRVSYSRAYGMGVTIYSEGTGLPNLGITRQEFDGVAKYIHKRIEKHIADMKAKEKA
ncbi:TPA: ParA family protein [Escherichia coli]|nr:ParA family protein [Escherichia coli]